MIPSPALIAMVFFTATLREPPPMLEMKFVGLNEVIEQGRPAKVSLTDGLKSARDAHPDGQFVQARFQQREGRRVIVVLALIEVKTEKGMMLMPKEVVVDADSGKAEVVELAEVTVPDAHAMVAGMGAWSKKKLDWDKAIKLACNEMKEAVPVAATLAGGKESPRWFVTLASKDDAVTMELELESGKLLGRAEWRASLTEVKKLMQELHAAGLEYDPRCAEVYADSAKITNTRVMPDGRERDMELTGEAYKTMLAAMMPMAKARGDRSTMREITMCMEGRDVRVHATRFSELKKYESPIDWLWRKNEKGTWEIVEENSMSRP